MPFSVKSQDADHPFHLAVYMSGSQTYKTRGDPDFVNLIPDDQFLDHYVFFVDHTKAGKPVATPAGSCTYGRHEATSDGPFMVYVWGLDVDASYGFPAGAGSRHDPLQDRGALTLAEGAPALVSGRKHELDARGRSSDHLGQRAMSTRCMCTGVRGLSLEFRGTSAIF
ncbi:hypothetical protein [Labilithrix luteola]|uniref:hypothetical protein n=1 Tax=Labilithrix luteola TaxID=1391654 RepID=UPI0023DDCA67|nr:hypothetical protein [Labilithrix luteola]